MNVGQKIARVREIRGMKQTDLAQRLGISQQALSKLENHEYIEEQKLKKVAEALGISTQALLQFQENTLLEETDGRRDSIHGDLGFDPIKKILTLYDELLETERKRIALLEELLHAKDHQTLA